MLSGIAAPCDKTGAQDLALQAGYETVILP